MRYGKREYGEGRGVGRGDEYGRGKRVRDVRE